LLFVEVALTVVLLIGAGLLLKSYRTLRSSDMGCLTDNVLTMRVSLPEANYHEPARARCSSRSLRRRANKPPPGKRSGGDNIITIPEHPPLPTGQVQIARRRFCDPGYFTALQIPLVLAHLLAHDFFPTMTPSAST
jgi:putative ABC transport system permease protein